MATKVLLLLMLSGLCWSPHIEAQVAARYALFNLGPEVQLRGLDPAHPDIVGSQLVNGVPHAAIVFGARAQVLPPVTVAHPFGQAWTIREGVTVGFGSLGLGINTGHAFRFSVADGLTDLGTLGSGHGWAAARAITGAGTPTEKIGGVSREDATNTQVAVVWSGGSASALPTLQPGDWGELSAYNSAGDGVGFSGLHATLWPSAGGVQDIHTAAEPRSLATDINDAQEVVGTVYTSFPSRGFVWTAATGMQLLPPLPTGRWSEANGINNSSIKVGYTQISDPFDAPIVRTMTIWDATNTAIDIQSRCLNCAGVLLATAQKINDAGLIIGTGLVGITPQAVVLVPYPTPCPTCPAPEPRPPRDTLPPRPRR